MDRSHYLDPTSDIASAGAAPSVRATPLQGCDNITFTERKVGRPGVISNVLCLADNCIKFGSLFLSVGALL